jgi:hypothetical protein
MDNEKIKISELQNNASVRFRESDNPYFHVSSALFSCGMKAHYFTVTL